MTYLRDPTITRRTTRDSQPEQQSTQPKRQASMNFLRTIAPTLIAVAGCVHPTYSANDNKVPMSKSFVETVEGNLNLPSGAHSLDSYTRYYAEEVVGGRRMLVGIFVYKDGEPGIRIVEPSALPRVLDGGCRVVNLRYDIERRKLSGLFCNGVA